MPSDYRYFVTYSGVKPPVRLVNPLTAADLENRNTYIRARYDDQDRLILFEKMVYGEIELAHLYEYNSDGALISAEIRMDDEINLVRFDHAGNTAMAEE